MSRTNTIRTNVLFGSLVTTGILVAAAYGITRWIGVDTGNLKNWVVGLLVLWWLIVVITLPWDLYFKARKLLADTQHSHHEGMNIAANDLAYVKRWAKLSFIIAISLHLISAVGLALLQYFGVSELGYYASGASVLLMGFRPAGRAYDYMVMRLTNIGREILFPRDDVLILKNQIENLQGQMNDMINHLNLDNKTSWASSLEMRNESQVEEQQKLRNEVELLRSENDEAHHQLAGEAAAAASKVAGGAQVINHVRELVRFFKDA